MIKIKKVFFIFAMMFLFFTVADKTNVAATENNLMDDLGYQYSTSRTIFKLYSSEAIDVRVIVEDVENGTISLSKSEGTNIWMGYIPGDLNGKEYSYYIKKEDGSEYYDVIDPYGKFINSTKTRNVIYSENLLVQPTEGEEQVIEKAYLKVAEKNRIIYRINVSNFTSHITWSGLNENRGKLLGLIEAGTVYSGVSTGYDYVSELGITYIELSNIFDDVLPLAIDNNYKTGNEQYSGNIELKSVVDKYYAKGIGIILSFNYDLLNNYFSSNIEKIDKSSYLNDFGKLDLSKEKTQLYIINLLKYYISEYTISGIMIENMADYSIEFINKITEEILKINSNAYIYGDGSYNVENDNTAGENNLEKLNNISMLNNSLTYGLFGNLNNNSEKGILDGNYDKEIIETIKFSMLSTVDNGQIDYSLVKGVSYKNYWKNLKSYQIANYFGNKNGLSIYDKLFVSSFASNSIIQEKIMLGYSLLMMSGGTPYIYSGDEFLSSYLDASASSTSVCSGNGTEFCFYTEESKKIIDWSYAKNNENMVNSFKSYINFKKSDGEIAQTDAETIKKNVKIYENENMTGVIGYTRNYPNAYTKRTQKVFVLFNFSNNDYIINEKKEKGTVGLYNYNSSNRDGDEIYLNANSFYTEKKIKQPKVNSWVSLIIVLAIIGGLYFLNITLNKKLVEKKGYDIKQIKKKYRPFIKVKKEETEKNKEQDKNNEIEESNNESK